MLGEELGRDARQRSFTRHGLRPVFAELRQLALAVRIGPGAARAIEALLLVHFEQCAETARCAHLVQTALHGLVDRVQARSALMASDLFRISFFRRRLRAGYAVDLALLIFRCTIHAAIVAPYVKSARS